MHGLKGLYADKNMKHQIGRMKFFPRYSQAMKKISMYRKINCICKNNSNATARDFRKNIQETGICYITILIFQF